MASNTDPLNNLWLAALPIAAQLRIFPDLELIPLRLGKVLYEKGDDLNNVYFPSSAVISLIYVSDSGAQTKMSMVGNEGILGVDFFMGGGSRPHRGLVSVAGYCYRLSTKLMHEEFLQHSDMQNLLLRYLLTLITQISQTALCNRHHSMMQKFCRWLLMSDDQSIGNKILTTLSIIGQEIEVDIIELDKMAATLIQSEALSIDDGFLRIENRRALETQSCECHLIIQRETARLSLAKVQTSAQSSEQRPSSSPE